LLNSSGSLPIFAAIRRASSRSNNFAAARGPHFASLALLPATAPDAPPLPKGFELASGDGQASLVQVFHPGVIPVFVVAEPTRLVAAPPSLREVMTGFETPKLKSLTSMFRCLPLSPASAVQGAANINATAIAKNELRIAPRSEEYHNGVRPIMTFAIAPAAWRYLRQFVSPHPAPIILRPFSRPGSFSKWT
jgi:hypothetical protein